MSLNEKTTKLVNRINRGDLPRTDWNVSFGFTKAVIAAFNYARQYPAKMASLKVLLEYVLERVYEWEERQTDIGEYKRPELRVNTAVTNIIGTDGKPSKPEAVEVPGFKAGEREEPKFTEVKVEPARVAPAPPPMQSVKAWMPEPTTVAKEEVQEQPVQAPEVPVVPLQVQTAPVEVPTIPSIPKVQP